MPEPGDIIDLLFAFELEFLFLMYVVDLTYKKIGVLDLIAFGRDLFGLVS